MRYTLYNIGSGATPILYVWDLCADHYVINQDTCEPLRFTSRYWAQRKLAELNAADQRPDEMGFAESEV